MLHWGLRREFYGRFVAYATIGSSFDFAPLRLLEMRAGCGLEQRVTGSVQALARADGRVDLVTSQGRFVGLARVNEPAA